MKPTNTHAPFMPAILVGGQSFQQADWALRWQNQDCQQAAANARTRHGHAVCLCRGPRELKLQIRQRDGTYHLAVWPNEGRAHDPRCAYFRDDLSDRPAPTRADEPTANRHHNPRPQNAPKARLVDMAQDLWKEGQLCVWHPSWSRDWSRVRYQLLIAARTLRGDEHQAEDPLARRHPGLQIYVPRPFSAGWRGTINSEWQRFREACTTRSSNDSTYVVVAPVREAMFGGQIEGEAMVIHLRHMNTRFVLDRTAYGEAFMNRMSRVAMLELRTGTGGQGDREVIAFLILKGGRTKDAKVFRACFALVHKHTWVPANSPAELRVIDAMSTQGYAYEHIPQWATGRGARNRPDLLVRHVLAIDGRPVARAAIDVLSETTTPDVLKARDQLRTDMALRGIPTWTWTASKHGGSVPPLPHHDTASLAQLTAWQASIRARGDLEYR